MGRHSRKVLVYNAVMQQIDEFESAEAAAISLGLEPVSVRYACKKGAISRYPAKKYGCKYSLRYGKQETQHITEVDAIESKRFIEAHNKFSERECLKCGVVFLSEGPWNRKCLSCKSAEADSAYQYADITFKVKTGKYQYFE